MVLKSDRLIFAELKRDTITNFGFVIFVQLKSVNHAYYYYQIYRF